MAIVRLIINFSLVKKQKNFFQKFRYQLKWKHHKNVLLLYIFKFWILFFNKSPLFLSIVSREKTFLLDIYKHDQWSHTSSRVSLRARPLPICLSLSLTHSFSLYLCDPRSKFNDIHAHRFVIRRYTMTRACTIHVIS